MILFSSLRFRLVGTVFLAVVLGWLIALVANIEIAGFAAGLLALVAAWIGGEHFIIRQVRTLLATAKRLAAGDLSARTGAVRGHGELADLTRTIDGMAETLDQRLREREAAERALSSQARQQAAVASLGQFALTTSDFDALIHEAVLLAAETLEVDLSEILQFSSTTDEFTLRDGVGWPETLIGHAKIQADPSSIAGLALRSQESIRVADYRVERRFTAPSLARSQGAVSGMTVAITGRDRNHPFGVLGAYSTSSRVFTDDEAQFLRAMANLLAMTIDRNLSEAEMRKRAVFAQLNPTPAMEVNAAGEVTYFNDAALALARQTGHDHPRELLPQNVSQLVASGLRSGHNTAAIDTCLAGRTFSWSFHPIPADQLVHCYITETTERLKMEASLRQADKMLAIGQLAAGVAHDFNNLLTVIQGHASILLQKVESEAGAHDSAQSIYFAAERAAGLTRQLLMFSRRNVKQTTDLDLCEVVNEMSSMLERLLGETIKFHLTASASLPHVRGDRNEIEQVVMNLVVNARDAMPRGGNVEIDLAPVTIAEADSKRHPEARVGRFVRLKVSDVGCGMDQATIDRIFEPFFTTKEVGKGTGLGLATVYGIAKQHEGWVEVFSKPGEGSTFSVYLPAANHASPGNTSPAETSAGQPPLAGMETVLVIEDEKALREMTVQFLENFGYRVLHVGSGLEARKVWQTHSTQIDLVLTDMVMPGGVSGRDLAKEFTRTRIALPVVIASGYSIDDISDELGGTRNISYIQKPYSLNSLTRSIRTALDTAKDRTPAGNGSQHTLR
jgi:signal transduction histidine kinase/CheY-like chemotaxis protein